MENIGVNFGTKNGIYIYIPVIQVQDYLRDPDNVVKLLLMHKKILLIHFMPTQSPAEVVAADFQQQPHMVQDMTLQLHSYLHDLPTAVKLL